jgi:hypothetical protein
MPKSNIEIFEIATGICQQVDKAIVGDSDTITPVEMLEMVDVLLCAMARITIQFDEHFKEYSAPRKELHERLDHWLDTASNGTEDEHDVH